MATTLIVPTRDRPRQMKDFLSFFTKFYAGQRILVLDGSVAELQPEVAQVCEDANGPVDITFKPYPSELSLFERLLDGVQSLQDDILMVAADDDFPMMETYDAAVEMLERDPSLSTAVPYDVVLTLAKGNELTARLSVARSIQHATAAKRVDAFSRWRFATSYGAIRKTALVARYRALSRIYCAGFIDYQIGIEDCLEGGIKALPKLGCIRTQTYAASYLRPADKLIFLRRAEEVLGICGHIATRLTEKEGLDPEAAQSVSNTAMMRQIGSLIGAGALAKTDFLRSPTFLEKDVQEQFEQFYQLFEEGSAVREAYLERLSFVTKCLIAQTQEAPKKGFESYEVL